jgi:hypothetical protein
LRTFLFFFLLVFSGAAFAEGKVLPTGEAVCSSRFSRLLGRAGTHAAHAEFRKAIEEVEAIPVRDVFPQAISRRGKKIVKVTEANKEEFQTLFDKLWTNRVAAGDIPASEISYYRKWLRKKYGRPYPQINPEVLHKDFVVAEPTGSLAGYFDDDFLDYLYESKKVTAENVDDYVKSLDPSIVKRFGRRAGRRLAKIGDYVITAGLTATILQVSTIPGDFVSNLLNGLSQALFGQTIKEFISSKTKEATQQVGEKVRDWSTLFVGGEEKYNSTLKELKQASVRLDSQDFDRMPRTQAAKVLEGFMNYTAAQLPLFQALVLSEQKDFESAWDQRLQELKQATIMVNTNFQQHKIALDQMQAQIASRSDPAVATPEELETMADYTAEMQSSESFLANALADWLFYKQARGPDNPLDPALDRNFSTVYSSYLRTMSPGKLAKAINARVSAHIAQLEKYSNKASGTKDANPNAPVEKPEDQIKTDETPITK